MKIRLSIYLVKNKEKDADQLLNLERIKRPIALPLDGASVFYLSNRTLNLKYLSGQHYFFL